MSLKYISYLEPWRPLRSIEWNHLCNYGRRHREEQFCEMILYLNQQMSLKMFLIWSPGGPFVQQSGTIFAVLVKGF